MLLTMYVFPVTKPNTNLYSGVNQVAAGVTNFTIAADPILNLSSGGYIFELVSKFTQANNQSVVISRFSCLTSTDLSGTVTLFKCEEVSKTQFQGAGMPGVIDLVISRQDDSTFLVTVTVGVEFINPVNFNLSISELQ